MNTQAAELNADLEAAIDLYMEEQMEKHGGLELAVYLRIREEARVILQASMGGEDGAA